VQPSHRLTLTSPHLIHLANRCCSALGCRNYQRDHINADSDELYDYDTLHRLDTFKRGTLSGLPNSPAITDDDRVREQTWPDMTDIGNWAKFYTKDSDGDYIRPYEDRTFNTTNEMTDINPSAINGGDPAAYVPGYDAAGNLTDMPTTDGSPGHEFVYDYRNRIIEVQDQNQSTVMKYCYDGLNRRVKKDLDSGTDILYIYDGWQVVEEREYDAGDTAWEARRQYVYGGIYIDEPLIFDKDTDDDGVCDDTRYFYCQQANYNVVALTHDSGTVVEKVAYDPYGEYTLTLDGSTGNTLLFQGRRWDSEADLYYFRNRSYSPRLGRFMQRDPTGYGDGMNVYLFARSSPLIYVDPEGLDADGSAPEDCSPAKAAVIGALSSIVSSIASVIMTAAAPFVEDFDVADAYPYTPTGQAEEYGGPGVKKATTCCLVSAGAAATAAGGLIGLEAAGITGVGSQPISQLVASALGTGGSTAASEKGQRAFNAAYEYATIPNNFSHLFKRKHLLRPLVEKLGSQEKVLEAVLRKLCSCNLPEGVFKTSVKVGNDAITVSGNVINGVPNIGTMYVPK